MEELTNTETKNSKIIECLVKFNQDKLNKQYENQIAILKNKYIR